jgi:hypothetical protein
LLRAVIAQNPRKFVLYVVAFTFNNNSGSPLGTVHVNNFPPLDAVHLMLGDDPVSTATEVAEVKTVIDVAGPEHQPSVAA